MFDVFLVNNLLVFFNDGPRGVFTKYVSNKNFYLNVSHSEYNDNYRKEVPTVNLFKLHGSLLWELFEDRIIVKEDNSHILKIREIIDKIQVNIDLVESIDAESKNEDVNIFVESLNSNVKEIQLDDKLLDDFYSTYSELPIINPNKSQ